MSTLTLAPVMILMKNHNPWMAVIIGNLIGASIFFWIDKYIFKPTSRFSLWQVVENIKCIDCGKTDRGYRLVKSKNYDKTKDEFPEFRCESCSKQKTLDLSGRGIKI